MAESQKNFGARVIEQTGLRLDEIPAGVAEDILGGKILCRRGDTVIVTVGYPDRVDPESGIEFWDPRPENFRVVDLSK